MIGRYKIKIAQDALNGIQDATYWYNRQLKGLGTRFQKQVKLQINSLKKLPTAYGKRYADVRCMQIKKFPYLVHFTIDADDFIVNIYGVLHAGRNPAIGNERLE